MTGWHPRHTNWGDVHGSQYDWFQGFGWFLGKWFGGLEFTDWDDADKATTSWSQAASADPGVWSTTATASTTWTQTPSSSSSIWSELT